MAKTALLAKLTAQDGKRDALLEVIATKGMANVAGEDGTEVYIAHKDQNDANVVWFYELYSDADALATHGGSDGMKDFGRAIKDLIAGPPDLIFLDPASGKGVEL